MLTIHNKDNIEIMLYLSLKEARHFWYNILISTHTNMYIEFLRVRVYPAAVVLTSMFGSFVSPVYADDAPRKQTFVVTAYYSPVPNQCCYFRGNYEDEIAFNGNGTNGADGTPVYPGMIAGPDTYAFGTRIELPGIGVGTIHDRGSRIIEWGEDVHRIDLWMGYGEEGLARAMAWGTRKVVGTVYPLGSGEMPAEQWSLDGFTSDPGSLAQLPKSDPVLGLSGVKYGDRNYAVRMLQTALKNLGYLSAEPNAYFGDGTKAALAAFRSEYGLRGEDGVMNRESASSIVVAAAVTDKNLPTLAVGLSSGSNPNDVRQAQKILRGFGYYRGRTDGVFDDDVRDAVTHFQLDHSIVSSVTAQGAGVIGPSTQAAILKAWKVDFVASKTKVMLTKLDVASEVKTDLLPAKTLASGDSGPEVRKLQSFLVRSGYLQKKEASGAFGSKTKTALMHYQMDRGIVDSKAKRGAGVFGPTTRIMATKDLTAMRWADVRAHGL